MVSSISDRTVLVVTELPVIREAVGLDTVLYSRVVSPEVRAGTVSTTMFISSSERPRLSTQGSAREESASGADAFETCSDPPDVAEKSSPHSSAELLKRELRSPNLEETSTSPEDWAPRCGSRCSSERTNTGHFVQRPRQGSVASVSSAPDCLKENESAPRRCASPAPSGNAFLRCPPSVPLPSPPCRPQLSRFVPRRVAPSPVSLLPVRRRSGRSHTSSPFRKEVANSADRCRSNGVCTALDRTCSVSVSVDADVGLRRASSLRSVGDVERLGRRVPLGREPSGDRGAGRDRRIMEFPGGRLPPLPRRSFVEAGCGAVALRGAGQLSLAEADLAVQRTGRTAAERTLGLPSEGRFRPPKSLSPSARNSCGRPGQARPPLHWRR